MMVFPCWKSERGEDALNYGWGIYFSEKPDVAMAYRDGLAGKSTIKGGALYEVELMLGKADLLDWDLPIAKQSEKVQQAIQKAIDRHADPIQREMMAYYAVQNGQKTVGGTFYRTLASMFGDGLTTDGREEASRFLLSLGIPGIRYLDAFSRNGSVSGEKTRNYVIFDDSLITIMTCHAGGMQVVPEDEVQDDVCCFGPR